MTATATRVSTNESTSPAEDQVSKALEDRIPADGEQVAHTLNPDRDSDTVRYVDPEAPAEPRNAGATAAQSNAEVQMARRTDAGPAIAKGSAAPGSAPMLMWAAIGLAAVLVIVTLIAMI
jgi:hypothetical protein